MSNSLTNKRIWWFIGLALCLVCGVLVFLPAVSVGDIFGISEAEKHSLVWFLEQAGFPELYTVMFLLYFGSAAVLTVCGFRKTLAKWPVILAAVLSAVFFVFNLFWGFIIMTGSNGFEMVLRLTFWSWAYIVLQTISIVNLFVFLAKLPKPSQQP